MHWQLNSTEGRYATEISKLLSGRTITDMYWSDDEVVIETNSFLALHLVIGNGHIEIQIISPRFCSEIIKRMHSPKEIIRVQLDDSNYPNYELILDRESLSQKAHGRAVDLISSEEHAITLRFVDESGALWDLTFTACLLADKSSSGFLLWSEEAW